MCMKTRQILLQKGCHSNLYCALASDSGSYSLDTHSINSTCYYWLAPRNLHNNVLFIRHKYCHCSRAKIVFFMSLLLFCSRSSHLIKYFLLFLFQNSVSSLFLNEETIWSSLGQVLIKQPSNKLRLLNFKNIFNAIIDK